MSSLTALLPEEEAATEYEGEAADGAPVPAATLAALEAVLNVHWVSTRPSRWWHGRRPGRTWLAALISEAVAIKSKSRRTTRTRRRSGSKCMDRCRSMNRSRSKSRARRNSSGWRAATQVQREIMEQRKEIVDDGFVFESSRCLAVCAAKTHKNTHWVLPSSLVCMLVYFEVGR